MYRLFVARVWKVLVKMSGLIMKYVFKRNMPDLHFGTDPYFEADDTRRKKFKQPPPGVSQHDAKILKKVRRKSYRLDQSISCCCYHFRIGWAAIIGLIPFIGDIIDALLAYRIIALAKSIEGGLPEAVVAQMYANVVVDFGIGLIPVVGDIADMSNCPNHLHLSQLTSTVYKCNTRNLQLLEKHLVKKSGQATDTSQHELGRSTAASGQHQQGHGTTVPGTTSNHAVNHQ